MKRALATKPSKKNKTDQPAPRRSRSAAPIPAEANSQKASLPDDENWKLHMATLRKAAAERAVLRNESRTLKQKAPIPYPVKSLENRYAALRKRSVHAPYDLIRKLMEDENWRQDMATLRKAAAERALLRNESPKLERRMVQAPI